MTYFAAIKMLREGKKVRIGIWRKDFYIVMLPKDHLIMDGRDCKDVRGMLIGMYQDNTLISFYTPDYTDFTSSSWEEYKDKDLKFEDMLKSMKEGKKAARRSWSEGEYILCANNLQACFNNVVIPWKGNSVLFKFSNGELTGIYEAGIISTTASDWYFLED